MSILFLSFIVPIFAWNVPLVSPIFLKRFLSSIQSLSRVWLFVTPCTEARQASLSITNSRSLLKLMSIESVMPSSHLILCRPFSSCPQSFPATGPFPGSALRFRGPKYADSASAWSCLIEKDPDAGKDWRQEENIMNLNSLLTIWWCPCVESSFVLLVFAMTSKFSWQNSVSLCHASFCTSRTHCLLFQVFLDFLLYFNLILKFSKSWKSNEY